MAAGIITGSTNNQYIDCRIVWSSKPIIATNSSELTVTLQYKRNDTGRTTQGTGTFSIRVDMYGGSGTKYITITESDWVDALSITRTVKHEVDGTARYYIWVEKGSIAETTLDFTTCNGWVELDTIQSATTIDSLYCSTNYFNGTLTYKYTPQLSGLYSQCNVSLNLNGAYIAVKTINHGKVPIKQETATVTLSADELSIIYNNLPNTNKGTLRFAFRTYSNANYQNQIGGESYKEIALQIPETSETQPSVSMSLSLISSLESPFNGFYIQGKTKVKASFEGSITKYSANISSCSMTVSGIGTYDSPYQSDLLSRSGTISVIGTVKDSRGFLSSATQEITVIDYSKPSLIPYAGETSIVCKRCDSEGNLTTSGTYLRIKTGRRYSKVALDGVQKNFCLLRYRYKTESGTEFSSWVDLLAKNNTITDEIDVVLENVVLFKTTSYIVQIGVVDDIGETSTMEITIPTDRVSFHLKKGGKGAAFGKYAETDNCVEVVEDWKLDVKGVFRANHIASVDSYEYKNFNDLIYLTGYYTGTSAPSSVSCQNYPIDETGLLEVISAMEQNETTLAWSGFAYQTYRSHTGNVYMRSYYSSTGWTDWKKVTLT